MREEGPHETSTPTSPPTPLWRHPLGLGLIGLVLLVIGWKLTTYVPEPPTRGLLEGLLRQAEEQEGDPAVAGMKEKLEEWTRRSRYEPRYRWVGQLVFFVGLALVIVAVVRMWQHRPPERNRADEEPTGID